MLDVTETEFGDQWLSNSSNAQVVMDDRCIFKKMIQNHMCTVLYSSSVCSEIGALHGGSNITTNRALHYEVNAVLNLIEL